MARTENRIRRPVRREEILLLAVLPLLIVGCSTTPEEGPDTERLVAALRDFDDAAAAQALLTDSLTGTRAKSAQDAGIPATGAASWLVGLDAAATTPARTRVVRSATEPHPGSGDEQAVGAVLAADRFDSDLYPALAEILLTRPAQTFGSLIDSLPWSPDVVLDAARRLAADEAIRETLIEAWSTWATRRLERAGEETEVLQALGHLVGAADAAAVADLDQANATAHTDRRALGLETLAEEVARAAGRGPTAAQAASARVAAAYREGLRLTR